MGAGRRDDAIKAFTAELTRNPNDFDANLYLGIMLKDDGKLDEAYEHLKRRAAPALARRGRPIRPRRAASRRRPYAGGASGAGGRDRGGTRLSARARPPGHRVLPAQGQGEGGTANRPWPRSCGRPSRRRSPGASPEPKPPERSRKAAMRAHLVTALWVGGRVHMRGGAPRPPPKPSPAAAATSRPRASFDALVREGGAKRAWREGSKKRPGTMDGPSLSAPRGLRAVSPWPPSSST
jgi:hypothetical protein